jgi:Fimbrial assembly protein (PilN)
MEHINFLNKKSFSLKHFDLNYLWILVIFSSLLFFAILFSFIQKQRLNTLEKKLSVVTTEAEQLKAIPTLPIPSDKKADMLENPIEVASILSAVSSHTPNAIHIKKISASFLEKRIVTLEGFASNHQALSLFSRDIEGTPLCNSTILLTSSREKIPPKNEEKLTFHLECGVK